MSYFVSAGKRHNMKDFKISVLKTVLSTIQMRNAFKKFIYYSSNMENIHIPNL